MEFKLVNQVFSAAGEDPADLVAAIERLAEAHGANIYRAVFRHLLGRDLEAERAARYWREALGRWGEMRAARPVQSLLRAALLDYLHCVVGERPADVRDPLTGLYHSAFGRHHLERLLDGKKRSDCTRPLSLAHLGPRDFPQLCALLEPRVVDRVLRQVAAAIETETREGDVPLYRGNGEFSLILTGRNRVEGGEALRRLGRTTADLDFPGRERLPFGRLALCGGVAAYPEDGFTAPALERAAAAALARARTAPAGVEPAAQERRRRSRRRLCGLVEAGGGPDFALVLDISCTGIAIGMDRDLPHGTALELKFRRPFWPVDCTAEGTVRSSSREPRSGMRRLGLEFLAAGPELERDLERLMRPALGGAAAAC